MIHKIQLHYMDSSWLNGGLMRHCVHCGKSVPQTGKKPTYFCSTCLQLKREERTTRYSWLSGKPIECVRGAWS